MISLMQTMVMCFTALAIFLPITFLVALAMPKNSEFRHLCMRVGYAGFALLTVLYFGCPVDVIPDVFFPVGFVDDAGALGAGFMALRKALTPMQQPGVN